MEYLLQGSKSDFEALDEAVCTMCTEWGYKPTENTQGVEAGGRGGWVSEFHKGDRLVKLQYVNSGAGRGGSLIGSISEVERDILEERITLLLQTLFAQRKS